MQKLLILLGLLATLAAPAQQAPWTGLPAQKKTQAFLDPITAEPLTLYLKVDTMHQMDMEDTRDFVSRHWHKWTTVGFGYTDKEGNPFGLWRYYRTAQQGYHLYCEGYYTALQTENLSVNPDIARQFSSAEAADAKRNFISLLSDRFLITGQWRFYEDGKLATILVLNNTVTLPYETSENLSEDGKSISSTSLVVAVPQKRLAGHLLTAVHLLPDGYLKSIHTEGLFLKFDSMGKPEIEKLVGLEQ